jgi:hypothetical protein
VTWGQVLAYAVASSVPCHLSTGAGGRQRRLPTGGAAYRIPRKMLTPFFTKPRTWPSAVVTTGPLLSRPSWAAAGPVARPAMRSAQAAKLPPQRRKSLLERTLLSICRAMLFLPTQMSIFGALAIKSANTLPGLLGIGDTWSSVKFFIMKWPASEGGGSVKNGAALDAARSILAGSQWGGDLVLPVGAWWPPSGATAFYHIACRTPAAVRGPATHEAAADRMKKKAPASKLGLWSADAWGRGNAPPR